MTLVKKLSGTRISLHRPLRTSRMSRSLLNRRRRRHSNRNRSLSSTILPLNTHSHILLLTQGQTCLHPGGKVSRGIDGASDMTLGPHRPVLLEVCVADDGRGVDAPFGPDFVGGTVALEPAVAG